MYTLHPIDVGKQDIREQPLCNNALRFDDVTNGLLQFLMYHYTNRQLIYMSRLLNCEIQNFLVSVYNKNDLGRYAQMTQNNMQHFTS